MSDAPFDLVDAKDTFTDSDWFHSCRETQTPYVVVRSGERSADVLWDYITLPPCCDARLRRNFIALERDARAIFEQFAQPESYLRIKPTMICFDHLRVDQAKSAAAALYRLIAHYLPETAITGPAATTADSQMPHPPTDWPKTHSLWVEEAGLA